MHGPHLTEAAEYRTLRELADWLESLDPDRTPIHIDPRPDRTRRTPLSLTDPMDLRRTRLDLDVTIQELALATGIHRDTIRRIENYEHTPTAPTIERLAAALGCLTGSRVSPDTRGLPGALHGASEVTRARRADPLEAAHRRRERRRREVTAGSLATREVTGAP